MTRRGHVSPAGCDEADRPCGGFGWSRRRLCEAGLRIVSRSLREPAPAQTLMQIAARGALPDSLEAHAHKAQWGTQASGPVSPAPASAPFPFGPPAGGSATRAGCGMRNDKGGRRATTRSLTAVTGPMAAVGKDKRASASNSGPDGRNRCGHLGRCACCVSARSPSRYGPVLDTRSKFRCAAVGIRQCSLGVERACRAASSTHSDPRRTG